MRQCPERERDCGWPRRTREAPPPHLRGRDLARGRPGVRLGPGLHGHPRHPRPAQLHGSERPRLDQGPVRPLPRAEESGGPLVRAAPRALAARGLLLRRALAGPRRDQPDRVELRPEHGPELRGRRRVDAVHALDVAALGHGRGRRRAGQPVESGGRGLRRGALPRRRRRARLDRARDLRLQPRPVVRGRRPPAGGALRRRSAARRRARPHVPGRRPRGADGGRAPEGRPDRGGDRPHRPEPGDRLLVPRAGRAPGGQPAPERGRLPEARRPSREDRGVGGVGPSSARAARGPARRRGRRPRRLEGGAGRSSARRSRGRRPGTLPPRAATSSRSAAAPAPSRSPTSTTTIPRPTSPRRRDRRSTRSPTRPSSRPIRAGTAGSASSSCSRTGSSSSTAISPTWSRA